MEMQIIEDTVIPRDAEHFDHERREARRRLYVSYATLLRSGVIPPTGTVHLPREDAGGVVVSSDPHEPTFTMARGIPEGAAIVGTAIASTQLRTAIVRFLEQWRELVDVRMEVHRLVAPAPAATTVVDHAFVTPTR